MANATEHPSVMFGTAGRAFHVLEKDSVDVLAFLQRIIDNVEFRSQLTAMVNKASEFQLPETLHQDRVERLIMHAGCKESRVELLDEEDRQLIERFANREGLTLLLDGLPVRSAQMIMLRYGLDGREQWTQNQVAAKYSITRERARQIEVKTVQTMRRKVNALKVDAQVVRAGEVSIEVLGLTIRPATCLYRAQIHTVAELVTRTEDDLLAITNFGQSTLDEVVERLRFFGLKLKSS